MSIFSPDFSILLSAQTQKPSTGVIIEDDDDELLIDDNLNDAGGLFNG